MRSSDGEAAWATATNSSNTARMAASRVIIMRRDLCIGDATMASLVSAGSCATQGLSRCRERHSRDTGLVKPALPLQDLLLGHGDGPAPPALVARERDVVARHLGRLALTIPQREKAVVTRGVVRGVLRPRRPLVVRRTPSQCDEHTADQQNPPQVATHDSVLRANEVVRPSSRGHATPELSRLQMVDSSPMDALTIHAMPSRMRRPILITAFSGWNDAAESATTAARYLATTFNARKLAEIDPEEFYHFGLSRPTVRFKTGSETEREIVWPATEFSIAQPPQLERALIRGGANVPHYISGIENPKAALALVRRVLLLLNATVDLSDLEDAGRQFDQNLTEIVAQNDKIASYIRKLESRDVEEEATPAEASDLPPASELVEEIEQFLRQQQRPE